MKTLLPLAAILLILQVVAHAQAPTPTPDTRKRMIFPPGSSEPVILSTPAPASAAVPSGVKAGSAAEIIEAFFQALKAEKVDEAYDALVRGTIISERQEDVAALKERTKHALDTYGPLTGYEVVDEQMVGTVLFRRTCLSFNSDLPLRWRFYFYKSNNEWKLVDLRVDDGLVELFEDAAKSKR